MTAPTEQTPTDTASYAVIAVELRYIKEAVERIERERTTYVPQSNWEQRNGYVDGKFLALEAKLVQLTSELASRRAPWWSVGSLLVAATALAVVLVPVLSK